MTGILADTAALVSGASSGIGAAADSPRGVTDLVTISSTAALHVCEGTGTE